jgi:hypothetical protein
MRYKDWFGCSCDVPVVAECLYLYVFIVPHYYEMNVADGFSCSFAGSKIGGKRSYLEQ